MFIFHNLLSPMSERVHSSVHSAEGSWNNVVKCSLAKVVAYSH